MYACSNFRFILFPTESFESWNINFGGVNYFINVAVIIFEAQQLVFLSVDFHFLKSFHAKIMVIYSQVKFASKGWNNNIKPHKGN